MKKKIITKPIIIILKIKRKMKYVNKRNGIYRKKKKL